ncbi:RCC1-like G exchanging factor-like protein [Cylas formicarius]|uniref:RCC1-like G exchanging factor-like protein n=1 Tax=Cylas formicarius TaxID=197179 RepID=UPI0029587CD9|nr:RCC1-like G exchanging factor-like protein [Cylas formicarius]
MNPIQKIQQNIIKNGAKYLSTKKIKYPTDPDYVNQLPVFQYGVSKEAYRRVFAWGNAQTGALGIKGLIDKDVIAAWYPKRFTFAELFEVTTAATGFGFTAYAVNSETDVKLHGSGLNTDGQLGYHEVQKDKPLGILFYTQPIYLPFSNPEQSKVIKLAAGRAHLLVLTDEGLFTLGNNAYGQCGRQVVDDEDYSKNHYITKIENIDGKCIVDIECGQDHSLAITEDGSVYSCGWGADGQTGLGHFQNTSEFTKVDGDISKEKIVKISCKSDFVLALNDRGEAFGWGNIEYGQLTLPNEQQQLCNPTFVNKLVKAGKIVSVASGGSFCLAVNECGEVFTWGYGLLGVGPIVQQSREPLKIPEVLFGRNDFQPKSLVTKVVCGLNYAMAVTNSGDLYSWGRNRSCCLGLGHEKDQYFPLKVSLSGHVDDVFCALDHTIAICKPFI